MLIDSVPLTIPSLSESGSSTPGWTRCGSRGNNGIKADIGGVTLLDVGGVRIFHGIVENVNEYHDIVDPVKNVDAVFVVDGISVPESE